MALHKHPVVRPAGRVIVTPGGPSADSITVGSAVGAVTLSALPSRAHVFLQERLRTSLVHAQTPSSCSSWYQAYLCPASHRGPHRVTQRVHRLQLPFADLHCTAFQLQLCAMTGRWSDTSDLQSQLSLSCWQGCLSPRLEAQQPTPSQRHIFRPLKSCCSSLP